MNLKKTRLLTPGPTMVPESILALSSKPAPHHRTPQFKSIMTDVQSGLKQLFQTKQDVLMLTSSGTGAMEAAICNLFSRGDKVITVNGGKFGERWTKLAKAWGLVPVEIKLDSGHSPDPKKIDEVLNANPDAKGLFFQASETSTGAASPVKEICALVKKRTNCLAIVDAITALGVMDLKMDDWGIDVLMTGSQKGIMLSPGLALISLSSKAWSAAETSNLPKFYFDLKKEKKAAAEGQTSWTPAIPLIVGLQEALKMMREEGLENIFARHELLGRATRAAVDAIGLKLLCKDMPSNAVTAVRVPVAIEDGKKIPKHLRDEYGVTITGGQDELEGKIFRLTHLGYIDIFDVLTGIGALEITLRDLGYKSFEPGVGCAAVLRTFAEAKKK